MSRYGIQPARQLLYDRGWSIPVAADKINVPFSHLRNVLHGVTPPSGPVRDRLPVLLGAPLSALFTESALSATYQPGRGPGGRTRREQRWMTSWDAR